MDVSSLPQFSDMPLLDTEPDRVLYVSKTGSDKSDGTAAKPLRTIQEAVDRATPGTDIMVEAGSYRENVTLPSKSGGSLDAPIRLISADGPGEATIVAANNSQPVVKGFGVFNMVIDGFEVRGGTYGIQINQSGRDLSALPKNIVIINNTITGSSKDGIKLGQIDGGYAVGNTIHGVDEQAIDLLNAVNSYVGYNDIYDITVNTPTMFAKAGSTNVLFEANDIRDADKDGIGIGGVSSSGTRVRPGTEGYEADNVWAVGNHVSDVGKRALTVHGAKNSGAVGNNFTSGEDYPHGISVVRGGQDRSVESFNIEITDNYLSDDDVQINVDRPGTIDVEDNVDTPLDLGPVGVDGMPDLPDGGGLAGAPLSSGASPRAPKSIDDLVLWYDAERLGSDGISRIGDRSGFGNEAKQSKRSAQADMRDDGVLDFDGDDFYNIENSRQINTGKEYEGKTITLALDLGNNVGKQQVIFEEGGATRGLAVYVDDGEVVMSVWGAGSSRPISVSADVEKGEEGVFSFVFDGDNGSISAYKNGEIVDHARGVEEMGRHSGGIGLGRVVNGARDADNKLFSTSEGYDGGLYEMTYHDQALNSGEVAGLSSYMGEKWLWDADDAFF